LPRAFPPSLPRALRMRIFLLYHVLMGPACLASCKLIPSVLALFL
jgi:hypothetical protein